MLCHWATTAGQPPTLTILYALHRWYWNSQTHTLRVCHQNSIMGWPEILSIRKEPMLSDLLTLNVRLPATAGLFTFLYSHLVKSKFLYFQHEARCSEYPIMLPSLPQEECWNCLWICQSLACTAPSCSTLLSQNMPSLPSLFVSHY